MIQIYKASNTTYEKNGDAILSPQKCEVDSKTWELELVNPLDKWISLIQEGAVLKVPDFVGKEQLYRIYRKRKSDAGVTAYARPIFMDSADDLFIYDQRPTNVNAQAALNILTQGTKYKAVSNITKKNTAYYVRKNLIDALLGDDENSFVNRWGGEPVFHNYTIYLNERAGLDRGVSVEFGLNMQSVDEDVDMEDVITRIVPVSYNGYTLENNGHVDSSNIDKYPKVYTREVTYSDVKLQEDCGEEESGFATLTELRSELIRRAKLDFENGADKPKITYSIDMADISYTNEYEGLKDLVNVSLGDTVKCRNRRLDIETNARVTNLVYDCIMERTKSIVLGDNELNIFDRYTQTYDAVSNVIDPETNSLIAEKIKGIIDAMQTTFRYQQTVAKRQSVRAILFEDTDPSSPLYGATCIGSAGVEFSDHRTPDGRDWDWSTAINATGILAPAVITGILSDKLGNTYWNLDTGELVTKNMKASNAEFSGTIKGSKIIGGSISGSTIAIGEKFKVDEKGNATVNGIKASNAEFSGNISGSSITGGTVNGTAISTDKDLTVGNNVYIGKEQGAIKHIFMTDESYIRRSTMQSGDWMQMYGSLRSSINSWGASVFTMNDGTAGIQANDKVSISSFSQQLEFNGEYHDANWSNGWFRPLNPGTALGGNSDNNRWYRLYAANTCNTSSDIRLKENIKRFDERYERMYMELQPVTYELKAYPGKTQCGLIAQWVKESMDKQGIAEHELALYEHNEKEDSYSLSYEQLTSLNMHMVQKAYARIEQLERKVSALEKKIKEEEYGR